MKQVQDTDLKSLRIFTTIADCGGFSAAQSVLNIGQSTISEYVNRLEIRLGARLCERGRGGFRLTETGKHVYDATQRLLASVEDFRQEMNSLTGILQGELRLGLIDNTITNDEFPLASVIRTFREQAPEVDVCIATLAPNELEQRLLGGSLHAAISPFPVKIQGIDYELLFEERHYLYCGRGHSLYNKKNISLEDLSHCPVVAHSYEHEAELKSIPSNMTAVVIDNMEAETMLIMTGSYIGMLPAHYGELWKETGKLKALLPEQIYFDSGFYLATKKMQHPPTILSAFVEHYKQFTHSH